MRALVYEGQGRVEVREVSRPEPGAGQVLIAVEACGVCGTDVKKIDAGSPPPPRVFGHEIAGVIAQTGSGVRRWKEGDRVVSHHHIPCLACYYCERKLYAQCDLYKRNGTTAGFEPAGGGFAEFLVAEPHIVERGLIAIPSGVDPLVACFVEPVNTCLKAVEKARVSPGETVAVVGQGPIGSILMQIARLRGARVLVCDLSRHRLSLARSFGAETAPDTGGFVEWARAATGGRGVDLTILAATGQAALDAAVAATRPGGRVLAFSATTRGERYSIDLGEMASLEKDLINAYSASVDVSDEAARLVFSGELRLRALVTDVFPLSRGGEALALFRKPAEQTMKIVVVPRDPSAPS